MFRIKICGVTSVQDAAAVATGGADALGLNFYSGSPRCVQAESAREIVDAVRGRVQLVGVFVNHGWRQVVDTARDLELDFVQLHGDEPPDFLEKLEGIRVIRAFRFDGQAEADADRLVERVGCYEGRVAAVLVDAHRPGQYGGTGATTNWESVERLQRQCSIPVVLAGGLTPENVAQAVNAARPAAIDAASGVEITPRRKSADRIAGLVKAATAAFDARRP